MEHNNEQRSEQEQHKSNITSGIATLGLFAPLCIPPLLRRARGRDTNCVWTAGQRGPGNCRPRQRPRIIVFSIDTTTTDPATSTVTTTTASSAAASIDIRLPILPSSSLSSSKRPFNLGDHHPQRHGQGHFRHRRKGLWHRPTNTKAEDHH